MVIRKWLLLLLLFAFLSAMVFAQTDAGDFNGTSAEGTDSDLEQDNVPPDGTPIEGEPSFRLSETDSGLLFFQRLTWEEARYAVRYTLILERKREILDDYAEVMRRNTEFTYIDISVPPGNYRYRVLSFNILGLLDSQSDWEYFEVLEALTRSSFLLRPAPFTLIVLPQGSLPLRAKIFCPKPTSIWRAKLLLMKMENR